MNICGAHTTGELPFIDQYELGVVGIGGIDLTNTSEVYAPTRVHEQLLLDALQTRLLTITTGADYYNTFSPNVFVAKTTPFETNELPGINIQDKTEEFLNASTGADDYAELDLIVEVNIITTGSTAAEVRQMKADVLKSIGTDVTFDALAINTKYIGSERNKADQTGNKIADCSISIGFVYLNKAWY